jgi:hypothetical protein
MTRMRETDHALRMLVRAITPSGNTGFYRFTPLPGTFERAGSSVLFRVRNDIGTAVTVEATGCDRGYAAIAFASDGPLLSFSAYVRACHGLIIPQHHADEYRAALGEWESCAGARTWPALDRRHVPRIVSAGQARGRT